MSDKERSIKLEIPSQTEVASMTQVDVTRVRQPSYGRFLEEFTPGTVFDHPRGLTINADFAQSFAATFMQANPLYLNEPYARAHGFSELPVSPMMVLNGALSLGVQNDSEQAIAHLGYYEVQFPRPMLAGDTLHSRTTVLSRRSRGLDERGVPKPGVVRVRTEGLNEEGEAVVRYQRAILIPVADAEKLAENESAVSLPGELPHQPVELPSFEPGKVPPLTGTQTYFEDFQVGEIILHSNGRTITEEHIPWTYRLGNTHPLHSDRVYSRGRSGTMSGEPIVYGGLVFAWLEGLASRDTGENALWDLGYTEGYHTQPAFAGDTLYAISRVLNKQEALGSIGAGIVTLQLIGVKNVTGREALEVHGAALFQKESSKKHPDRISEKLFEIERRLLIKNRAAWGNKG